MAATSIVSPTRDLRRLTAGRDGTGINGNSVRISVLMDEVHGWMLTKRNERREMVEE